MNQAATKIRPRPTEEYSANLPRYELRLRVLKASDFVLEVWQLPSSATPRLTAPEYVAGLKGSALRFIEPRLLKRLSRSKINLGTMNAEKTRAWKIDEDLALNLGLLFRVLAPMRNLDRIRQVADGVDETGPPHQNRRTGTNGESGIWRESELLRHIIASFHDVCGRFSHHQ